ncbi:MAG: hypothetical protein KA285_00540 [Bacteroidia bacterium]|nr:hypothetical protein [Bacteroidia bacterium]
MKKLPDQMSDDEIIDKVLRVFYDYRQGAHDLYTVLTVNVGAKKDSQYYDNIEEKMLRHNLLFTPKDNVDRHYQISELGKNICENGGWFNHNKIANNWFLRNDSKNLFIIVGIIISVAAIIVGYIAAKKC